MTTTARKKNRNIQAIERGGGGSAAPPLHPMRMVLALLTFALVTLSAGAGHAAGDPARGEKIFHASGCVSCHTDYENDGEPLAGGRPMETVYGTFYTPNITPDEETGIGGWSDAEFVAALKHGHAPDGSAYYPIFPYTSYAGMREQDILDLKAYMFEQPAVTKATREHDLMWPFGWRWLMIFWQWIFFDGDTFEENPDRDAAWNHGAYLTKVLGHCDECHTPRTIFGSLDEDMLFAGTSDGPEGVNVPNITPDPETGIGSWTTSDITWLLFTGFLPDGDNVQGVMGEVVDHSTSKLEDADREAIAVFLESLDPIYHRVGDEPAAAEDEDDTSTFDY